MKKYYYAIKVGRGVQDKIVTTWDECKKYTFRYNSIYKGFRTEHEAKKWLDSWNEDEIEYRLEKQLFYRNKRLKRQILYDLNFRLSIDILNFILENTYNYEQICLYIDKCVENDEFSSNKAIILKNYLKENIIKN